MAALPSTPTTPATEICLSWLMRSALHSRQFVLDGAISLLQSITRDRMYRRDRPISRPIPPAVFPKQHSSVVKDGFLKTQPDTKKKRKRRRRRGKKKAKTSGQPITEQHSKPFGEDLKQMAPLSAPRLAPGVEIFGKAQVNAPYDPTRAGSPITAGLFSEYIG